MSSSANEAWIVTAKIHIPYENFQEWLYTAPEKFKNNIKIFNCDTSDPFIKELLNPEMTPPATHLAAVCANKIIEIAFNYRSELFYLQYNNNDSTIDLIIKTARAGSTSISTLAYDINILLTIADFKANDIPDMILISNGTFDNLKYAIEINNNDVDLIKTDSHDLIEALLLHSHKHLYDILATNPPLEDMLDPNIYNLFSIYIDNRLEKDRKDIIKLASVERPIVIARGGRYITDGQKAYYNATEELIGADLLSIESLGSNYIKDKERVYYKNMLIEGADAESFKALYYGYSIDNENIYFHERAISKNKGSFHTFRHFNGYAADNENVFFNGRRIPGADPFSFTGVGDEFFKDSVFYTFDDFFSYLNGITISYIDKSSLVSLGKNFFKDKNSVFFVSLKLPLSPNNARMVNEYYIANDVDALYIGKDKQITQLQNVISKELKANGYFATDGSNIYYKGHIIPNIDLSVTDIFDTHFDGYLVGNEGIYYHTHKVEEADPKTFKHLPFGYAIDEHNFFYRGKLIKERLAKDSESIFANLTSLSLDLDDSNVISLGSSFKRIHDHIYYKASLIRGADADSFKPIDVSLNNQKLVTNYALDKKNVFYKNFLLSDVQPDNFEIMLHPDYDNAPDIHIPQMARAGSRLFFRGIEIPGIDAQKLKPFSIFRVWVAGNTLIYKSYITKNIDIERFKQVEGDIYSDGKHLFYKSILINGIDCNSAVILSNNYIKDDNYLCYIAEDELSHIVTNIFSPHINSFDIFPDNPSFSFDRFKIYFNGEVIEEINMEAIEMIGDNYLKDDKHIFCGKHKLENIDKDNFFLLGDKYATDGKTILYQNTVLETTSVLHVLGAGYASDGVNFFLYGKLVDNPYEHQYITNIFGTEF